MTRKEQKAKRPEGWVEVTSRLERGEITQSQACEELKISKAWLNILLHRDNPGRKSRNPEVVREIGLANKKYTTYLEKYFSDYEVCMMLKARDNCDKCPLTCKGYMKNKGIRQALMKRVLLKADEKPTEIT